MTKGWCPVHDRIVDGRGGKCPECGTPLVDLAARPRPDDEAHIVVEKDEPAPIARPEEIVVTAGSSLWPEIRLPDRFFGRDSVSIGPVAIAAILAAAVVASFLVGLAIPRSDDAKPDGRPTPTARAEHRVRREQTAAGVRLRLDSFSQRGRRVVLRVTVPDQRDVEIGRITQVIVAPEVASGSVLDEVSLEVRTTVTGFVAEGPVLERDDLVITGIRITRLEMFGRGHGRTDLDLSRVWPEEPRGPLASERTVRVRFPGRDIRVVGLVGWPDHLEILIEERRVREGWLHSYKYTLLTGGANADGEVSGPQSFGARQTNMVTFQACDEPAFQCVPRGLPRVTLLLDDSIIIIGGRWSWEFI